MDKRLFDIICCPVTHLPLEILDGERLRRLNAAISGGNVRNRADQPLKEALTEALVTRDGRLAYPIRDDIPMLVEEECIDLKQLPA
jgi:uncharacterized protein YbaR (Trm112 family)